jgi:5-formyltetrahydrofolate cyclo-ligase
LKKDKLAREKAATRASMKAKLAAVGDIQRIGWSGNIAENLFRLPQWVSAEAILAFLPMTKEVDTEPIIKRAFQEGKTVGVPRMYGDTIKFHHIHSLAGPWDPHPYGLREPPAQLPVIEPFSIKGNHILVVTPGLCFDTKGNRLGFGRGYYDRFITDCRSVKQKNFYFTGVCFSPQIIESVPTGDHDCVLDAVISESGIEYIRNGVA